jgi:SRSO17 transposase
MIRFVIRHGRVASQDRVSVDRLMMDCSTTREMLLRVFTDDTYQAVQHFITHAD